MPKLNKLSHREEHRIFADMVGAGPDATSTALDYQHTRRAVAARRREEQRQARIAAGTDRASRRDLRRNFRTKPYPMPGRLTFVDALIGR